MPAKASEFLARLKTRAAQDQGLGKGSSAIGWLFELTMSLHGGRHGRARWVRGLVLGCFFSLGGFILAEFAGSSQQLCASQPASQPRKDSNHLSLSRYPIVPLSASLTPILPGLRGGLTVQLIEASHSVGYQSCSAVRSSMQRWKAVRREWVLQGTGQAGSKDLMTRIERRMLWEEKAVALPTKWVAGGLSFGFANLFSLASCLLVFLSSYRFYSTFLPSLTIHTVQTIVEP